MPLSDGSPPPAADDPNPPMSGAGGAAFRLDDSPGAVRAGRYFVEQRVRAAGASALVDDAMLIASELLANAQQHGLPPVTVRVDASTQRVRIAVTDASPRSPVRAVASEENMTGRGLALIAQLATSWGVEPHPGDGKTVWCEVSRERSGTASPEDDVGALLAAWDDERDDGIRRYSVILGDVPTSLLLEAKAHIDNLVREFSLAASGSATSGVEVPRHLAELMNVVVHGFADARSAIKRQALAAAARGDARTSLVLYLPASAAEAGEAYLAALDEADGYARAARLLTLETPPGHRLFRRWYVEAVIEALRRAGEGLPPLPVEPFEQRLLQEVTALSVAHRVAQRAARLQQVTAALARARTPHDVADVVVREGVEALGAFGGSLLVPADDGEHLSVPGTVGYGPELVDQLRAERIDANLPAAVAMRTGEPVWLESRPERDELFPELRGFEPAAVAMCAVPLEIGDRRLGALRFSFDRPRLFDENERHFVLALASATAQTLERSELYLAERKAALQLQRALLPQAVSVVPGWDIAAHYSPAGDEEVGGDWFDVIPVDDGCAAAVLGDVMGRGVGAAAAMAQVRSAVRAYVAIDPDPAAVLNRLDHLFEVLEPTQLVTMLYLLVDTRTGEVKISNAGHLPPLLLAPEGSRRLDLPPALPLGAGGDIRRWVAVEVPVGSALVAVTDGLVERRGEDIDVGIDRLLAGVQVGDHTTSTSLLDALLATARADRLHDDDVTALVLRREPV